MNEYIAHVKQSSVGMGHVVQLGLNRASKHTIGLTEPQILMSRYPAQLSNTQPVQLQAAGKLAEKLQGLSLEERKALNISEDLQFAKPKTQIVDMNYPMYERVKTPDSYLNYADNNPSFAERLRTRSPHARALPMNHHENLKNNSNIPENCNTEQFGVKPKPIVDVNYPVYERVKTPDSYLNYAVNRAHSPNFAERLQTRSHAHKNNLEQFAANEKSNFTDLNVLPDQTNISNTHLLPHYAPATINTHTEMQNPQKFSNIRDLASSTYDPITAASLQSNYGMTNDNTEKLNNTNRNYKNLPAFNVAQDTQKPMQVNIGAINDIVYPKLAERRPNEIFELPQTGYQPQNVKNSLSCHRCKKPFEDDAIVIGIERSTALFHASCFKCKGCNQNLADLVYFYHEESDDIYCGRDYAKIRGIPRCKACDELIFVKEYCLAENTTFHVKHFCCFECDTALAGQDYLMEDSQPVCLPCFEKIKANRCGSCFNIIKADETGAKLNDLHFHVNDICFACKVCKRPLLGMKLLLKNQRLYCSKICYGVDD